MLETCLDYQMTSELCAGTKLKAVLLQYSNVQRGCQQSLGCGKEEACWTEGEKDLH